MASSYYKIGTDVYGTQEGKLNQQQFQNLGLNFNLLGEGIGNAKALSSGQDTETKAFVQSGGKLGSSSAAVNAGYTYDPKTNQVSYKPVAPVEIPKLTTSVLEKALAVTPSETNQIFQNKLAEQQSKNNQLLQDTLLKLQLTPEEKASQERLLGLQQLQTQAMQQVQERPLDGGGLRSGLESEIQNIASGNTRESLVRTRQITQEAERGQLLTAQRNQELEGLKLQLQQGNIDTDNLFKMQSLQSQIENDYFTKVIQLNEVARNSLATILDKFQGLTLDQLDGQSLETVMGLAQQAGVPFALLRDGMKVVADQIQIERAQKQQQLNFDQEYKTDSLNIDRARLGLQQQELYQRIIENAGIDGMLNDKDIKTIESSNEGKTLVNLGELMRSAENYSDLLGQYGTELFGSGKTLLDGAYADLQVKWKEAAKLGALTGPDLQLIFDAIKPATGFRGAFSALTGGGTSGIKSGVSSLMDRITSEATVTYDRLNSRNKKYAGSNYVKQLIQPFLRPNNDDPIGVLPRDGQLVNDPIKLFQ